MIYFSWSPNIVKFWTIIILVFQQLIDGETRDSDGFCSSGLNMKEVKGVGLKPSLKIKNPPVLANATKAKLEHSNGFLTGVCGGSC
mmetsp:Transcript_12430/g.43265  ORF Transcript_12430/g.43265 Transcript_12430/m.43265 type:complete len:86 (+) Transcript_12430:736-993(+)